MTRRADDSGSETSASKRSSNYRKVDERFEPTPAWCNACKKEHPFNEFVRVGLGVRFMCAHDKTSKAAQQQNFFYRRLVTDSWFTAKRHSWKTVGEIVRRAMDKELDPKHCDLLIHDDDTDNAEFVAQEEGTGTATITL